jgi:hypothetical protein
MYVHRCTSTQFDNLPGPMQRHIPLQMRKFLPTVQRRVLDRTIRNTQGIGIGIGIEQPSRAMLTASSNVPSKWSGHQST